MYILVNYATVRALEKQLQLGDFTGSRPPAKPSALEFFLNLFDFSQMPAGALLGRCTCPRCVFEQGPVRAPHSLRDSTCVGEQFAKQFASTTAWHAAMYQAVDHSYKSTNLAAVAVVPHNTYPPTNPSLPTLIPD